MSLQCKSTGDSVRDLLIAKVVFHDKMPTFSLLIQISSRRGIRKTRDSNSLFHLQATCSKDY